MIEIISQRAYGEARLSKPKELKGIKQIGSVKFSKASCPVFMTGDVVYVKHRDWFSPSVSIDFAVKKGIIDRRKNKFIYNDNFGAVVLRNEAWLRITKDFSEFEPALVFSLIEDTTRTVKTTAFNLHHADWVIFFEELIRLVRRSS